MVGLPRSFEITGRPRLSNVKAINEPVCSGEQATSTVNPSGTLNRLLPLCPLTVSRRCDPIATTKRPINHKKRFIPRHPFTQTGGIQTQEQYSKEKAPFSTPKCIKFDREIQSRIWLEAKKPRSQEA